MKVSYKGNYCYRTDIGKIRSTNEDETKVVTNADGNILLIVADGMGGHNKGDYASFETVRIITEAFKDKKGFLSTYTACKWLKNIAKVANSTIYNLQDQDVTYKGMGTTLSIALIIKDKLIILNCGDSRIYLKRDNALEQLSEDQTYVNFLVKSGQITKEEALIHPERHVLTNAVGIFPSLSVDVQVLTYTGETVFLCTDGLYNNVREKDILNVLDLRLPTNEKVQSLISLANFNGGSDNITIAMWETIDD